MTRKMETGSLHSDKSAGFFSNARWLILLVSIAWAIEIVDRVILGGRLDSLGIHPRRMAGLVGIVLAPFLHLNFAHLMANTLPFLVLGYLVILRGKREFVFVSLVVMILGGSGVWLLGSSRSCHIGASGLIFGYLGYLLMRGWFERSFQSILLAGMAVFLYGGILWGVLPGQRGISWLGHLTGLLAGGLAGHCLARTRTR